MLTPIRKPTLTRGRCASYLFCLLAGDSSPLARFVGVTEGEGERRLLPRVGVTDRGRFFGDIPAAVDSAAAAASAARVRRMRRWGEFMGSP